MSQHLIDLKRMNSWVRLQLQPAQHDNYPFVRDSMHLAKDQSLLRINATVTAFCVATLGVNKIGTDIIGLSSLKMAFPSTFLTRCRASRG